MDEEVERLIATNIWGWKQVTPERLLESEQEGRRRFAYAKEHGFQSENASLHTDIHGAGGEAGFADWLGVLWLPQASAMPLTDVAGAQVRTTEWWKGGLPVKQLDQRKNRLGHVFVCVYSTYMHLREFYFPGWAFGYEVVEMPGSFKKGNPDYWLMPYQKLRPMSTVRAHLPELTLK